MVEEGTTVFTLSERSDLSAAFNAMPNDWPEFMKQDPAGWNLSTLMRLRPEYQFVAMNEHRVAAYGRCAPVPWEAPITNLPSQGWDDMLGRAVWAASDAGRVDVLCAFEISVASGSARARPQQAHAQRHVSNRAPSRIQGSRSPGSADGEASGAPSSDERVCALGRPGWATPGSMAASTCSGGRTRYRRLRGLDVHRCVARSVAAVDRLTL